MVKNNVVDWYYCNGCKQDTEAIIEVFIEIDDIEHQVRVIVTASCTKCKSTISSDEDVMQL